MEKLDTVFLSKEFSKTSCADESVMNFTDSLLHYENLNTFLNIYRLFHENGIVLNIIPSFKSPIIENVCLSDSYKFSDEQLNNFKIAIFKFNCDIEKINSIITLISTKRFIHNVEFNIKVEKTNLIIVECL